MTDLFDDTPINEELLDAKDEIKRLRAVVARQGRQLEECEWPRYTFTPRAAEVKLISVLLESAEYADSKEMAAAVFKESARILAMRDTYALVVRFGETQRGINFGPYSSISSASTAGDKLAGAAPYTVSTLYSSGQLAGNTDGAVGDGFCLRCQHRDWAHVWDGASRGRCGLAECRRDCEGFTKAS